MTDTSSTANGNGDWHAYGGRAGSPGKNPSTRKHLAIGEFFLFWLHGKGFVSVFVVLQIESEGRHGGRMEAEVKTIKMHLRPRPDA